MLKRRSGTGWTAAAWVLAVMALAGQGRAQTAAEAAPDPLRHGRELLANKQPAAAAQVFRGLLKANPVSVPARVGLGDADLAMQRYEAAEMDYREAVSLQPELWQAHKNLVVVEAALGRWEEFDRERTVLRLARQRGAPGIRAEESDVIDRFEVRGQRWVVRWYFVPLGRSRTIYNFERFSPDGRAQEYISLEDEAAAQAALTQEDVRVGAEKSQTAKAPPANSDAARTLCLNWYTSHAHGTLRCYPAGEPRYEALRTVVMRWLSARAAPR